MWCELKAHCLSLAKIELFEILPDVSKWDFFFDFPEVFLTLTFDL